MRIRRIEVSLTEEPLPRLRITEPGAPLGGFCKTLPMEASCAEAFEALHKEVDPWTLLAVIPEWPTLVAKLTARREKARCRGLRAVFRFNNVSMTEADVDR